MSQDFGRSARYSERKNKGNFALGGIKVSHFRVFNNGSLLQSFLYAFRRGADPCSQWRGVCNSEVSAGRELTVGVHELRVNSSTDLVKKLSAFFHKLTVCESPVTVVKMFIACQAKTVETAFFVVSSFYIQQILLSLRRIIVSV